MPDAKCQSCGKAIHWRNRRGSRLADYRCACGGRFKAYTYAARQRDLAGDVVRMQPEGRIWSTERQCYIPADPPDAWLDRDAWIRRKGGRP